MWLLSLNPLRSLVFDWKKEKQKNICIAEELEEFAGLSLLVCILDTSPHRIAELLRLEGTSGDRLVQPLLKQGHQNRLFRALSIRVLDPWGGRLHNIFGEPVPVFNSTHTKAIFTYD